MKLPFLVMKVYPNSIRATCTNNSEVIRLRIIRYYVIVDSDSLVLQLDENWGDRCLIGLSSLSYNKISLDLSTSFKNVGFPLLSYFLRHICGPP